MRYSLFSIFGIIICIVIIILLVIAAPYGFNTLYDEAYFLLALQDAYSGIVSGTSQWNQICIHLFPFLSLTNKATSYIVNIILSIISAGIIAVTSIKVHRCSITKAVYLSLLCELLYLSINPELNYVSLQGFFFACTLCCYEFSSLEKNWGQRIYYMLIGISSILEILTIPPSGIIISAIIFVLLLFRDRKPSRILCLIFGFIIGSIITHLCFVDLSEIYSHLRETISSTISSSRGYSPFDMLIAICMFLRDWVFTIIWSLGVLCLCSSIRKCSSNKHGKKLAIGLYVILLIVYLYYQKKPVTKPAMVFSALTIIFAIKNMVSSHKFKANETLNLSFFLLFPLLGSIGTNIYLGTRMGCFMLSYVLVFSHYFPKEISTHVFEKYSLILCSIFIFVITSIPAIERLNENTTYFISGNPSIASTKINSNQAQYFNDVKKIMESHGYNSESSTILGFNEDFGTMFALGSKSMIRLYAVEDVHLENYNETPDFIFLTKYQEECILEQLNNSNWGWPEQYEEIFRGTPDPDAPYDTERSLYCRNVSNPK